MNTLYAASLFALAATPAFAQSNGDRYIAQGSSPLWSVTIDGKTMRFERAGAAAVIVSTPRAIKRATGDSWRTHRIAVSGTNKLCTLASGDRSYAQTVVAVVDGKRFSGCGGLESLHNPRAAIDGDWNIVSINGKRVARNTTPTLSFRQGLISGNASCNRMSGSYSFKGDKLVTGPLALSRRACPSTTASAQERAISRLFSDQLTFFANMDDTLTLAGPQNNSITLLRSGRR